MMSIVQAVIKVWMRSESFFGDIYNSLSTCLYIIDDIEKAFVVGCLTSGLLATVSA